MRGQTTHRQRFARSVDTPSLSPTMADINAHVYSLTYWKGCAKHIIRVLAANPEQAAAHGTIRLRSQGDLEPPAPAEINEMKWADVAMKVGIASCETPGEWQLRQDAYQPAGKP